MEVKVSHTLGGAVEGIPKKREVNRRREVCELEGCVCVYTETIGASSMLRLIHRSVALVRMFPTLDLNWE